MAAACAAAIAALIAIDIRLRDSEEFRHGAAGNTARAPLHDAISVGQPGAMDREVVRYSRDFPAALTPDEIERALAEASEERRDLVLHESLAQLASHDGPAAARVAERRDKGYLRELALRTVAQHWSRRDAEAAIAWAMSLSDQPERDAAMATVALELAVSDPEQALQALSRRSGSPTPDVALEGVIQQWATQDFESAHAWVDAQPIGPDRDALLVRLVFARLEQSPPDAARIANGAFHDEAHRVEAVTSVASRWGAQDPESVREWALSLDSKAQEHVRVELELL